jgi:formate hydrogenlyase subunit 6/NADH:ubiquinone oxidoreductase subunit I
MKIGTMLRDVSTSLFRKPVTERYPFERRAAPNRLRGKLEWDPEKCIGCGLCVTDCPANALELIVLDKKEKQFVLVYHMDRCTFCAQCVQSCRHECLAMLADEWELAALNKDAFKLLFGEEANVARVLAGTALPDDEEPASD